MIPLRDDIPSQRKPVISYLILLLNVIIFSVQMSFADGGQGIILLFGAVPGHITGFVGNEQISFFDAYFPAISYMFVHGGFLHIAGNLLFLWVFADNVEDYFGHVQFLVFYLLCGIGALLIQVLFSWSSPVPIVGASGALAGVMGAYFVLYPKAKIVTLVPIVIFIRIIKVPAVVFLGLWILLQFVSASASEEGVAWWAHIGGFFVGIILLYIYRNYITTRKPPKPPEDKIRVLYN